MPASLRLHHQTLRKKKCRATESLEKTFIARIVLSAALYPLVTFRFFYPGQRTHLAPAAKNHQCRRSLRSCVSAVLLKRLSPGGTRSSFVAFGVSENPHVPVTVVKDESKPAAWGTRRSNWNLCFTPSGIYDQCLASSARCESLKPFLTASSQT
jgi:hypothetical protein